MLQHRPSRILTIKTFPDGIFNSNDFCTAVIMQTLKEAGIRIPQDVSVIGNVINPNFRLSIIRALKLERLLPENLIVI